MQYLFDTDVVSNLFKKRPAEKLLEHLRGLPKLSQFISTLTVFEIVCGAMKSLAPEKHLRNLKEVLLPTVNVLPFDKSAAFKAGELRAFLEKEGTMVSVIDLQIASIAIVNECTLVTGNEKHFRRIPGLSVENWL